MCKIVTNLLILILSRLFIAACNNLIVMNTQFQNIFIAAFEERCSINEEYLPIIWRGGRVLIFGILAFLRFRNRTHTHPNLAITT